MVLVPADTPGVKIIRPLNVFGYDHAPHGHVEITFDNVRVPVSNVLLGEGRGFEIAQGRLGPGASTTACASIGLAERALELMCKRASSRVAFGKTVAQQTVTQERIAEARCKIDMARLLTLKAAWLMDIVGQQGRQDRDRHDQGGRTQHGLPGDRLGHAGPRRRRHVATTSPWPTPTPVRAPCALPTARTKCTAMPLPRWELGKYGSYGRDAGVPITRGA